MAQADTVYKSEQDVLSDILSAWTARFPDASTAAPSLIRTWSEVFANSASGFLLGLQLLHNDLFVQTMSALALQREGQELGRAQKVGVLSAGSVIFTGAGGAFISSGSQVGAPRPALGDTLVFETTEDVTIPDPGVPTAPTAADGGSAGNPTGTLEYAVTFATAGGETAVGASSNALAVVSRQVDLTDIPLGGPGTTARKVYRSENGGSFQLVTTIADNTTTTYTDDVADGSLGGNPPATSTAEQATATAQATETGISYNVGVGTITSLVSVDGDVTSVTNSAAFTGGEDPEAVEDFRQALLQWKENPQTGSANDLVSWATSIDGIDSAAVFKNVNLSGDAELGSVVLRISGVGGSVPGDDLVTEAQDLVDSKVLANITVYVGTFTPVSLDVTAGVELQTGYVLADVEPSVQDAIATYIDAIASGDSFFIAGAIHAAFSLPGVRTLTITSPATDQDSAPDEKFVAGTIAVNEVAWS